MCRAAQRKDVLPFIVDNFWKCVLSSVVRFLPEINFNLIYDTYKYL